MNGWAIFGGNFPAGVHDKTPLRRQAPQDARVGIPSHKQPVKGWLPWLSKFEHHPLRGLGRRWRFMGPVR